MVGREDNGSGYFVLYAGEGTFTLLLVDQDGGACVVASAHDAEVMSVGKSL